MVVAGVWGRKKPEAPRGRHSRAKQSQRGSSSFSYYQNRVIPNDDSVRASTEREQKQLRSSRTRHLPTVAALIIVVICFGYILSLSQQPKVLVVNQQDQATQSLLRPIETYQSFGQEVLQRSPLNKTKLLINTDAVERDIQKQFPEVSRATVSLPLINRRPVIYLQITQPVFLLKYNQDMYALDSQGRIIMKGDSTLPHSDLVTIEDQNTAEPEVGKPYLPANHITFLQEVTGQLKAKGIGGFSFILPPLANEVYLKFADKPYFVKMTFSGDPRSQTGTYLAVRQKLETDKVTPSEYIDARVDDRAYYK